MCFFGGGGGGAPQVQYQEPSKANEVEPYKAVPLPDKTTTEKKQDQLAAVKTTEDTSSALSGDTAKGATLLG